MYIDKPKNHLPRAGIEPTTPCLQVRCSTNWAARVYSSALVSFLYITVLHICNYDVFPLFQYLGMDVLPSDVVELFTYVFTMCSPCSRIWVWMCCRPMLSNLRSRTSLPRVDRRWVDFWARRRSPCRESWIRSATMTGAFSFGLGVVDCNITMDSPATVKHDYL